MKKLRYALLIVLSLFAGITFSGCENGEDTEVEAEEESEAEDETTADAPTAENLLDVVKDDERFDTLLGALEAADLFELLTGEEPYTVLAPRDEAFDQLDTDMVEDLMNPLNKDTLAATLRYHIVPGKLTAKEIEKAGKITTVDGIEIPVSVEGKTLVLPNGVQVIGKDIEAGPGMIHVIDKVLLPQELEKRNLVEVLKGQGNFDTFLKAADAAELTDVLQADGPFTVFAPSDEAFQSLPDGRLEELLKPENRAQLRGILEYHVADSRLSAAKLITDQSFQTSSGAKIELEVDGDNVKLVDGATIVTDGIPAKNGVIHVIDAVMTPPDS